MREMRQRDIRLLETEVIGALEAVCDLVELLFFLYLLLRHVPGLVLRWRLVVRRDRVRSCLAL